MFTFIIGAIILYFIARWAIRDFVNEMNDATEQGEMPYLIITTSLLVILFISDVGVMKSFVIAMTEHLTIYTLRHNGVLTPIILPIFTYVAYTEFHWNSLLILIWLMSGCVLFMFIDIVFLYDALFEKSESTTVVSDKVK